MNNLNITTSANHSGTVMGRWYQYQRNSYRRYWQRQQR
jgi:hypothetical protein